MQSDEITIPKQKLPLILSITIPILVIIILIIIFCCVNNKKEGFGRHSPKAPEPYLQQANTAYNGVETQNYNPSNIQSAVQALNAGEQLNNDQFLNPLQNDLEKLQAQAVHNAQVNFNENALQYTNQVMTSNNVAQINLQGLATSGALTEQQFKEQRAILGYKFKQNEDIPSIIEQHLIRPVNKAAVLESNQIVINTGFGSQTTGENTGLQQIKQADDPHKIPIEDQTGILKLQKNNEFIMDVNQMGKVFQQ